MGDQTLGAYNIADLREMARRKVPRALFEYIDRGAEDEVSLRNNRTALERVRFKPRTLIDVSKRSQAITLFGRPSKMPVMIAPMSMPPKAVGPRTTPTTKGLITGIRAGTIICLIALPVTMSTHFPFFRLY